MKELLELLKDGHARSVEMLAIETGTSLEDVRRQIEYLERMNVLRRVSLNPACHTCGGSCPGCIPENGFQNMGEMWEVVEE